MSDINNLKLNQVVKVILADGTEKEGIVKGINQECTGEIKVRVEYLTPVRNDFKLENVTIPGIEE